MSNYFIITLKTSWSMMKRKKIQSILLGIIVMLITTLLYTGISMVDQSSSLNVMFERANATENIIIIKEDENDIDEIVTWWQARSEVEGTITYNTLATSATYDIEGENKSEWITITEYVENAKYDLLYETDKVLSKTPLDNEILINYNFAKTRELELGDTISFVYENMEYEFIVAGFVIDSQYSTPFMSSHRCYVKPGFFKENNIANEHYIGVKYNNIEEVNDVDIYEDFVNETGSSIIYHSYDSIISSYTIISSVTATLLLSVSVFMFAVAIFVIRSVVRNLILASYRQVGIRKVLGYTNKQIRNSFLLMYSLIGTLAAIIGVIIGMPIRNIINDGLSHDIQVGLESSFDLYFVVSIVIVVALINIFTYMTTKQTNRIKPVQAIKYGMPEGKVSMNKFSITGSNKIPLNVLIAIKQMLINKNRTISTTITITILIYVAFIINSSAYSLADSENFINNLYGMKVGDFSVTNNESNSAEFIDLLKSIESVESAIVYEITSGENTKGIEDGEIISIKCMTIYGVYPQNGIKLVGGREPANDSEIIISSKIAKKTGKTIGDYLSITDDEEEKKFLISGIFSTVINSGSTYIRLSKEIPEGRSINNGLYWVYSKEEHVIIDDMEMKINNLSDDEILVSKYDSTVKDVLATIKSFPRVMKYLFILFLIISGVVIMNFTIMDIHNSIRAFGIMKATGFSTSSFTKIMVIKSVILTAFGVILGFVLHLVTANMIMQMIFSVTPFSTIHLPVLYDDIGSLIMMILFIIIAVVSTLLPARRIGKISPKILMNE